VWWVYLIIIYPAYFLALGNVLHDALLKKRAAILFLIFPIIMAILGVPWAVVLAVVYYAATEKLNVPATRKLNLAVLLLVSASLLAAACGDVASISRDDVSGLRQVVSFISSRTNESDIVASNPNIMWLFKNGVDYAHVAFYTTQKQTYLYPPELYPRFKLNVSLERVRYIVLDYPKWMKYYIGNSQSAKTLTPEIENKWKLVFNTTNMWVYENPKMQS
jgi:hypothetical protein